MLKLGTVILLLVGLVYTIGLVGWFSASDGNSRQLEAVKEVTYDHEFSDYRFLVFGTSKSWGATLENPYEERFSKLLSPNSKNLAIRASGPEIPASCTYTMVGETDIYDVIIIEYYLMASSAMLKLTKRLKQRFPDATFIFITIWAPYQFVHKQTGESLREIFFKGETPITLKDQNWNNLLAKLKGYKNEDFEFGDASPYSQAVLDEAINITKGHLIRPYLREDRIVDIYSYAWSYIMSSDTIHWSKTGHMWVKDEIVKILRKNHVEKKENPKINPWAEKDACVNFYETGNTDGIHYDPTLHLNEFRSGKWALEMPQDILNPKTAWIEVNNPMNIANALFVNFMVVGPRQRQYPKALLSLNGGDHVVVDPFVSVSPHGGVFHITRQYFLGMAPPGKSTIHVKVLEKAQYPFRIAGIMVTPMSTEEVADVLKNQKRVDRLSKQH